MGFLDTVKGWFGIGQPKVEASVDRTTFGPGALLTVKVALEGGSRDIAITAVEVRFRSEEKEEEGGHSWDTLAEERVYLGGQMLAPGGKLETQVQIQVPRELAASGGPLSYKIEASADVAGWDPEKEIPVTVTDELDAMAAEDAGSHHVLAEKRDFRHSSVRGDFRVVPMADGVLTQWKNTVVCRDLEGNERWRQGVGRVVVASPDGTKVAVSHNKQVSIFDGVSGEEQIVMDAPGYVNNISWVSEGLALNSTEAITVVTLEGEVLRSVESFGDGDIYCGSMASQDDTLFAIDSNDRLLVKIDSKSGEIQGKEQLGFYPSDVYAVGEQLVLDSDDTVAFFGADLKSTGEFEVPGREGIRYLGQDEGSSTCHKVCGRLNPSGDSVLVNDRSGMLWLLGRDGTPKRSWHRGGAIDYVEDTGWISDSEFVAITNEGQCHRVRVSDGGVAWSQRDV